MVFTATDAGIAVDTSGRTSRGYVYHHAFDMVCSILVAVLGSGMSFIYGLYAPVSDLRQSCITRATLGWPPLVTVIRLLPAYITGVIYNVILTILMSRVPFALLMVSGNVLTAVASLLFAVINPKAVYWVFGFPAAVLAPAGGGFAYACSMIYLTKVARPHEQSMVGAVVQTMTQVSRRSHGYAY